MCARYAPKLINPMETTTECRTFHVFFNLFRHASIEISMEIDRKHYFQNEKLK